MDRSADYGGGGVIPSSKVRVLPPPRPYLWNVGVRLERTDVIYALAIADARRRRIARKHRRNEWFKRHEHVIALAVAVTMIFIALLDWERFLS